jgi:uncharacterized protein YebE (UPF0316 family)
MSSACDSKCTIVVLQLTRNNVIFRQQSNILYEKYTSAGEKCFILITVVMYVVKLSLVMENYAQVINQIRCLSMY